MIPLYALQGEQRRNFLVEYVVIGGGGSGGTSANGSGGGGGGAGGYRSSVIGELSGRNSTAEARLNLTQSTTYTVTIGAGGPRLSTPDYGVVGQGNATTFASISALGGGGGCIMTNPFSSPAPGWNLALLNGGSGGGAGDENTAGGGVQYGPGTGATGQGFDGGNGAPDNVGAGIGGGGGGAGQAGGNASLSSGGKGGDGIESSITGTSIARGGGGGGAKNANLGPTPTPGQGGAGGGGDAGSGAGGGQGNGSDGVANTGGGGGSQESPNFTTGWSGGGGSGVVIVRYPVSRLINVGPGLTATTSLVGDNKVTIITAGTGQVSWV